MVGRNIKIWRLIRGIKTAKELARRVQIDPRRISLIENDKVDPRLSEVRKIAQVLRIDITTLQNEHLTIAPAKAACN